MLLASYPVVRVVAANADIYPIDTAIVARALMIVFGLTSCALWLVGRIGWSLSARAAWLSTFLLLSAFYTVFASVLPLRMYGGHTGAASAYVVGCLIIASMVVRPWRRQVSRLTIPLAVIAIVLIVPNAVAILRGAAAPATTWAGAVDRLTTLPPTKGLRAGRDVYFIILDGFARPDVLDQQFGLDVTPFVASLRAQGFYVPTRSRSNYSQTFLAVSSMLNMQYLDEIATAMGTSSQDRRPLKTAIERNALMRLAKRAGYTVTVVGSDYTATDSFPLADQCLCATPGPHELEFGALRLLPLADLGLDQIASAVRRRKVLDSFEAVEHFGNAQAHHFVVVHILSPHPPFVLDREGGSRMPAPGAPFIAGEWLPQSERMRPEFDAEYVQGYSEQVRFIAARVQKLVGVLLDRGRPAPAIVIVGDHGSARRLDLIDPAKTDMHERMSIFSAYYLPDSEGAALYPEISPINGARALAMRYLGADIAFLPEASLFSTFHRPYELVPMAR